jgi:hypothetical protein
MNPARSPKPASARDSLLRQQSNPIRQHPALQLGPWQRATIRISTTSNSTELPPLPPE